MNTLQLKLKRVHTKFPYHRFWSSSWSIGNCGGILGPSFNGKPWCKWVQGRQAAGTYQILTFTQPPLQCYPLSRGRAWLFSQSINDNGWYSLFIYNILTQRAVPYGIAEPKGGLYPFGTRVSWRREIRLGYGAKRGHNPRSPIQAFRILNCTKPPVMHELLL